MYTTPEAIAREITTYMDQEGIPHGAVTLLVEPGGIGIGPAEVTPSIAFPAPPSAEDRRRVQDWVRRRTPYVLFWQSWSERGAELAPGQADHYATIE
jgi:hypothetical protein